MELRDTFPAFERFWATVEHLPIPDQIRRWELDYMAPWPDLLEIQKENYRRSRVSWRQIARRRIFPKIPGQLPRLRRLHARLRRELPSAWARARAALHVDFEVRFVIYVGLGCGAGWATRLGGQPTVLLGLENAAEIDAGGRNGWPGSAISHEVAHLVHAESRRRAGLGDLEESRGPYFRLYEEGFATECERNVEKPAVFRLRTGRSDWLPWCERHRADLARTFLREVRARRSVRRFFGSWYSMDGQIECGYYLGAEAIRQLRRAESLVDIAAWTGALVRRKMSETLRTFALDS